jgi:hypothetical protein
VCQGSGRATRAQKDDDDKKSAGKARAQKEEDDDKKAAGKARAQKDDDKRAAGKARAARLLRQREFPHGRGGATPGNTL